MCRPGTHTRKECIANCAAAPPDDPQGTAPIQWTPGVEVPSFVATNRAAVLLCRAILAGVEPQWPLIVVSEAVAVQVFRLAFDWRAQGESSKTIGWPGVYTILASLKHRSIVQGSMVDVKRLSTLIGRTRNGAQAPGLEMALRDAAR